MPTPEEQCFLEQWRAGITDAVDGYRARVSVLRPEIAVARGLEVHVSVDDGPPTIELKAPLLPTLLRW